MNEELILKAAVKFKGVWPDGYEALVVSTETNDCWDAGTYQDFTDGEVRFNSVMDDTDTWLWVCTKQEFEAFIDSLFEGAPEDAEYYLTPSAKTYPAWIKDLNDGECKYKVIINTNLQEYTDKDWNSLSSDMVLKSGSLIPRPRKQEVEQVEWMPEVGQECEVYGGAYGSDDMRWMKAEVMSVKDGEVLAESTSHSGTYVFYARGMFRPLKTEAEKEREALIPKVARIVFGSDTTASIEECETIAIDLVDAGVIDKSAFYD